MTTCALTEREWAERTGLTCRECGRRFHGVPKRKYCSKKCRNRWNNRNAAIRRPDEHLQNLIKQVEFCIGPDVGSLIQPAPVEDCNMRQSSETALEMLTRQDYVAHDRSRLQWEWKQNKQDALEILISRVAEELGLEPSDTQWDLMCRELPRLVKLLSNLDPKPCEWCGGLFVPEERTAGRSRFCSDRCKQQQWQRKQASAQMREEERQ